MRLTVEVDHLDEVGTKDLPTRSPSLGALRKEAGIFYDDVSIETGQESDRKLLKELDESHPYDSAVQRVSNPYNFKSPVNVIVVTHGPEKRFVRDKRQKRTRYWFYFLSPQDYDAFFQAVRDGSYPTFRSALQVALAR